MFLCCSSGHGAVGKVPLPGSISLPPFGVTAPNPPAGRQRSTQLLQLWFSCELVAAGLEEPGLQGTCHTKAFPFLLPAVSMASEGPWTRDNAPAGTIQSGSSRSWYHTAPKMLFKGQSSLEPCPTPLEAVLAAGQRRQDEHSCAVMLWLLQCSCSTLRIKGSSAALWTVADAPPRPACIE